MREGVFDQREREKAKKNFSFLFFATTKPEPARHTRARSTPFFLKSRQKSNARTTTDFAPPPSFFPFKVMPRKNFLTFQGSKKKTKLSLFILFIVGASLSYTLFLSLLFRAKDTGQKKTLPC